MRNKLTSLTLGRLRKAPEHFLEGDLLAQISQTGLDAQRRNFIRKSFLGALATTTGASALAQSTATLGDPAILEKQIWATTLGKPLSACTRIAMLKGNAPK
jgi:sulfane dehydrogenase subunit SoxC